MFIHCLWTFYKRFQHQGYGQKLIQAALHDAERQQMDGTAVLTREKPWLARNGIFLKNGFEVVDSSPPDYELLVKKIRKEAPAPRILNEDPIDPVYEKGLILIRSGQCPHTIRFSEKIRSYAREEYQLEPRIIELDTPEAARTAPTPYAVSCVISEGTILADHHISQTRFRNIMEKRS